MRDKDIGDNEPIKVGSQVSAVLFACNIHMSQALQWLKPW